MTVQTTAGTTLYITATTPATFDATGYATAFQSGAKTVGEIIDLGEFGREYTLVTHNPIDTRGTQKFKGSFNEGSMALQLGLDQDDEGQILMQTALNSDADYSFEITLQNGDIAYFQAKVMSFKIGAGGVDNITSATCTLELTTSKTGVGIVWNLGT